MVAILEMTNSIRLSSMTRLTTPFSGRGGGFCQVRGGFLIPRPWPASADGRR
jgi:hypothetical protein